jgi:hypothetical protein
MVLSISRIFLLVRRVALMGIAAPSLCVTGGGEWGLGLGGTLMEGTDDRLGNQHRARPCALP